MVKQKVNSDKLENQLNHLESKQPRILQEAVSCISVPIRLMEKDIKFSQAPKDSTCKNPNYILFSPLQYCEY